MNLRIIMVSWNVRERLRECLRSIAETTRGSALACEVVVVDNASRDRSADMVRAEFPWAQVIANTTNRGFAAACNQGIRHGTLDGTDPSCGEGGKGGAWFMGADAPEYFLLLNPDMRVMPGTVQGIVAFMREPRNTHVGVAGCHLVNERGETVPQVRRFPELSDQLAIMLKLPHAMPRVLNRYLMWDFDYTQEARVDSIRGSFFCIRRACLEQAGLLDERYFIWFEEVDFCKRARDAGWEVAYTPAVQCVDYVGKSFVQVATAKKQRMFTRSMCTYFRKHHAWWKWAVLAAVRPFAVGAARMRDWTRPTRTKPRAFDMAQ